MTEHATLPQELPTYSGSATPCAMCGATGADTKFLRAGACIHGDGGDYSVVTHDGGELDRPRMHRTCVRCGYQWDEKPLADPGPIDRVRKRPGARY